MQLARKDFISHIIAVVFVMCNYVLIIQETVIILLYYWRYRIGKFNKIDYLIVVPTLFISNRKTDKYWINKLLWLYCIGYKNLIRIFGFVELFFFRAK